MRFRPLRLATVLLVGGVLAGCSGDDEAIESLEELIDEEADDPAGDDTPPPEPESEPNEADDEGDDEPDPDVERFAVPDDIDEDYVLAVLDAMADGLIGPLRASVEAGEVTSAMEEALAAVYSPDHVDVQAEGIEIGVTGELDGQQVDPFVADAAPKRYLQFFGQLVSEDCIVGDVEVDTGGLYGIDDEPWPREVVLRADEPAPPVNPTPWRLAYEGLDGPGVDACDA